MLARKDNERFVICESTDFDREPARVVRAGDPSSSQKDGLVDRATCGDEFPEMHRNERTVNFLLWRRPDLTEDEVEE